MGWRSVQEWITFILRDSRLIGLMNDQTPKFTIYYGLLAIGFGLMFLRCVIEGTTYAQRKVFLPDPHPKEKHGSAQARWVSPPKGTYMFNVDAAVTEGVGGGCRGREGLDWNTA